MCILRRRRRGVQCDVALKHKNNILNAWVQMCRYRCVIVYLHIYVHSGCTLRMNSVTKCMCVCVVQHRTLRFEGWQERNSSQTLLRYRQYQPECIVCV